MEKAKLIALNEILGAIAIPNLSDEQFAEFKNDPVVCVNQVLSNGIYEGELTIIENSDDVVHLALPYYPEVDALNAQALAEGDLDNIAGGEILISIFAAIGVGAAWAVGAAVGIKSLAIVGVGIAGGVVGGAVGTAVTGVAANKIINDSAGLDFHGNKKKKGGK